MESDNLELFILYAKYNRDHITHIPAKYGAIKILKYVHSNGCKWNTLTCQNAVEGGI